MVRRRNYFIKKKFQMHFVFRFIVLLLMEAVLITGLFMYVATNTLTTGYFGSRLTVEKTSSFFFVPLVFIMLIVGIAVGIMAMVIFILLSHRIAGPLYRFEADLKAVAGGDLTKRVNLRRTDQLLELKEAMNLLVSSLDRRLSCIKARAKEMEAVLSKGALADPKIAEDLKALKKELDYFKVTSVTKE